MKSMIALPTNIHLCPPPPVAAATAVAVITPILMGHKKLKLNEIDPFVTLLYDDNVEMLYPHLSSANGGGEQDGFDITNPSVVKSMHVLLTELTIFFSTNYELI
jgi:hypothetical protein